MKKNRTQKGWRMQTLLLTAFVSLILVTVVFVTTVLSLNSFSFMKDHFFSDFSKVNQQVSSNIDTSIDQVGGLFNILIMNRSVFDNLLDEDFGINSDSYEAVISLKDLMHSFINNTEGLQASYYYPLKGAVISSFTGSVTPGYLNEDGFYQREAVKEILDHPEREQWITDDIGNSGFIFYMRGIRHPSTGGLLGVLVITLEPALFKSQISLLDGYNRHYYICDSRGIPFISTREAGEQRNHIVDILDETASRGTLEKGGMFYISQTLSNGWQVVTELEKSHLYSINQTLVIGLMTSVLSILLGALFSVYYSRRFIRDISVLTEAMKKSGEGRLEEITVGGNTYESRILATNFNAMTRNIDRLTGNLRQEIRERIKVENENESLLRFMDDNPSPIVRLSPDRVLDYSNASAGDMVVDPLFHSGRPDSSWFDEGSIRKGSEKGLEVKVDNRQYKVRAISPRGTDDLFLHFLDVTLEREYAHLQNLWDNMFENSSEGITITDSEGRIERINKSFTRITGYKAEEVLGKSTNLLKSDRHPREFYEGMWKSLLTAGRWSGEIWNRRKSGEAYPEWLGISSFNESSSGRRLYFAIFHDISDIKLQEEKMEYMTHYDALTGFPKRPLFLEKLQSEFNAADRNDELCAVMIMNIDGLKNINNGYGFQVGDAVLQEFSRRLAASVRNEDVVSRFGGDEFAVLTPRLSDRSRVYSVLKRIRQRLLEPISADSVSIDLSVSFGIALFPIDGHSSMEVITRAGLALRRTKQNRKGSYSTFDSDLDDSIMSISRLEIPLRKALAQDEFEVFFQPKVHSGENRIVGFETLIRWKREEEGYISPAVFIPLAEESGIIVDIGYFVIEKACDFVLRLKENNHTTQTVGINISARQLAEHDFIGRLLAILKEKGVRPSEIDLEITESITASKVYNAVETLTQLSGSGFSISIDDFGTGYSSLKYLMTLPFDTIKIDKSFVDSILEEDGKDTILNTMITLAHSLKKSIVAEGVETREQLDYLEEQDCRVIQGYYYARPQPSDSILALMDSGKFSSG